MCKKIMVVFLTLFLSATSALAYDHPIRIINTEAITATQVRYIVEVTEILCGKKLNGPLTVVFIPSMKHLDNGVLRNVYGATDCKPPYAVLISAQYFPVFQWGVIAHEVAHNLRPSWSEYQILNIEYQFRQVYRP